MNSRKYFFIAILVSVIYLLFIGIVNYKALAYPFALRVDILGDLEHLNQILDINSWKAFVEMFVLNNPNPYHGFISLYIPAIFGLIPRMIWGESGLIYTFQMFGAVLLIISYWLYVNYFTKNALYRLLGLITLISLPYTNMFAIWPRCESYLLFFTALFLYLEKRNPSSANYIILGLAFISRISLLVYIPFLVFISIRRIKSRRFQYLIKSGLFFVLGMLIAQPHLVNPKQWVDFLSQKIFQLSSDTGVNAMYSYLTWMNKFVVDYFAHPFAFYFIVLVTVSLLIYLYKVRNTFHKEHQVVVTEGMMLYFPAVMSLLLIMNFVKIEDSGWYLQHHVMFILIILLSSLEIYIRYCHRYKWLVSTIPIAIVTFIISLQVPGSPFFRGYLKYNYDDLWNKSNEKQFLIRVAWYRDMSKFLKRIDEKIDGLRHIMIMGDLFHYESTASFLITHNWSNNPFDECELDCRYDAIIVSPRRYDKLSLKKSLYERWVSPEWNGSCIGDECFEGFQINSGVLFLYRKKKFPFLAVKVANDLN